MDRVRGVMDGKVEATLRYTPGGHWFDVRITHYESHGTMWRSMSMNTEQFAEFRKQVNVAWAEYEKAHPPSAPNPAGKKGGKDG